MACQWMGVLATWHICSGKAALRGIKRIFTHCRSMCNQGKICGCGQMRTRMQVMSTKEPIGEAIRAITISRKSGSGGGEIGARLAARLNYG